MICFSVGKFVWKMEASQTHTSSIDSSTHSGSCMCVGDELFSFASHSPFRDSTSCAFNLSRCSFCMTRIQSKMKEKSTKTHAPSFSLFPIHANNLLLDPFLDFQFSSRQFWCHWCLQGVCWKRWCNKQKEIKKNVKIQQQHISTQLLEGGSEGVGRE